MRKKKPKKKRVKKPSKMDTLAATAATLAGELGAVRADAAALFSMVSRVSDSVNSALGVARDAKVAADMATRRVDHETDVRRQHEENERQRRYEAQAEEQRRADREAKQLAGAGLVLDVAVVAHRNRWHAVKRFFVAILYGVSWPVRAAGRVCRTYRNWLARPVTMAIERAADRLAHSESSAADRLARSVTKAIAESGDPIYGPR